MWVFSIASFTAVIFIVSLKLMVTSRYFTWFNMISIFFLSLGIYFTYVWASNYTGFSNTYASVPEIFGSPLYYLTVVLCVSFCYIVDIFIESWKFEFRTNPTDFLRKVIKKKKDIEIAKYLD